MEEKIPLKSMKETFEDKSIVSFLDDEGFKVFEKGEGAPTYYNSGKVKSGVFDLTLMSGTYMIVMDNQYSYVSTKNVQLQAAADCV